MSDSLEKEHTFHNRFPRGQDGIYHRKFAIWGSAGFLRGAVDRTRRWIMKVPEDFRNGLSGLKRGCPFYGFLIGHPEKIDGLIWWFISLSSLFLFKVAICGVYHGISHFQRHPCGYICRCILELMPQSQRASQKLGPLQFCDSSIIRQSLQQRIQNMRFFPASCVRLPSFTLWTDVCTFCPAPVLTLQAAQTIPGWFLVLKHWNAIAIFDWAIAIFEWTWMN